ncbi:MAG: hypothetical protein L6Q71_10215 [Planctomycetes bacterium]|nr:hypothetical protein [Planctomycetota bacterium]NUQ35806.1 hypothetical protein [Planctomycetaceae bacterium]
MAGVPENDQNGDPKQLPWGCVAIVFWWVMMLAGLVACFFGWGYTIDWGGDDETYMPLIAGIFGTLFSIVMLIRSIK